MTARPHGIQVSGRRVLFLVWLAMGMAPMLLQVRSYLKFASPHKISQNLAVPAGGVLETADLWHFCPVEAWFTAGVWWNISPTHYFRARDGFICHYVLPQYNVHGNYYLGNRTVAPYATSPASCAQQSTPFEHYFYHGSIGYYSLYGEVKGTYCIGDKTARLAKRCDNMGTVIRLDHAMVYVQESMRLSAHGARNYHRVALVYLLVEGLMSDLFLLTTQEGIMGRVQCISLGYNLAGIMSMLFEMIEVMNWMRESTRYVLKRLLFNYETVLVGELICAGAMQYYVSSLNHSSLKDTRPEAEAVSYYVMSLVGHAVILGGYSWDNGRLYYTVEALKAFGIMKMVEEDGHEFLALHKLYWFVIPSDDLFVIGTIWDQSVVSCAERPCSGVASVFGQRLGGVAGVNRRIQDAKIQSRREKHHPWVVHAG
ncbi:hypothetical protein BBJ28_00016387 [Nothophytophthora sp. Chile5]|nr:hypothetical protein BBJ28_00016387 [Nothophytophthora sp. Chile5]